MNAQTRRLWVGGVWGCAGGGPQGRRGPRGARRDCRSLTSRFPQIFSAPTHIIWRTGGVWCRKALMGPPVPQRALER